MIKLIWYINPLGLPIKQNAKKDYDAMFNPEPGCWCVSTSPEWHKNMTPEEIANMQKGYDEAYERNFTEWVVVGGFLSRWSIKQSISEEEYKEMISDKALEYIYVFRYEDKVLIASVDYNLDQWLMKCRMNWGDKVEFNIKN